LLLQIRRLKENILPILNALDKVKQIQGVTFDWIPLTKEQRKILHGNEGHDIGVIAQEIEAILPELVTTRNNRI
jgi:trimeric autotransporter adhesin